MLHEPELRHLETDLVRQSLGAYGAKIDKAVIGVIVPDALPMGG